MVGRARRFLSRLRGQLPPPQGGQFAQSPELAALHADILAHEQVCETRFAALIAVADQRARLLEQREQDARRRDAGDGPSP